MKYFTRMAVSLLIGAAGLSAQTSQTLVVSPRVHTSPVLSDADDAAIWMHPTDPSKSLIIGTDKGSNTNGGLVTWNLDGTQKQRITLDRPNSVDVRSGWRLGTQVIDLAAVTLRDQHQVRIFKIDPVTRKLTDITTLDTTNVLNKMFNSPYGIALYRRPSDGVIFVIASSRNAAYNDKLWQIRLQEDGPAHVKGVFVRAFGAFSGIVEGMVADDELGYLYALEEKVGIHKYYADPQNGNNRLVFLGTDDSLVSKYEGLALYKCDNGTGYLLATCPPLAGIRVYRREGENGDPHQQRMMATIQDANAVLGEGLEVISLPLGAAFPHGMLAWHDQAGKNFRLYGWEDVAQKTLTVCDGTATDVATNTANANPTFILLQQNSPNPLSLSGASGKPDTQIRFVLKKAGPVRLTIYNVLGEEVRSLLNAMLAPGTHTARWDAKDNKGGLVSTGIYFYQLRADQIVETRRMVLTR